MVCGVTQRLFLRCAQTEYWFAVKIYRCFYLYGIVDFEKKSAQSAMKLGILLTFQKLQEAN